jgi:hypothetical protein
VSGGRSLDRRSFLLLRPTPEPRAFELSCEQLYMRYVDARLAKRRDRLFDRLRADLSDVQELRLLQTEWLSVDDLRTRVEALTNELRARGVRVT